MLSYSSRAIFFSLAFTGMHYYLNLDRCAYDERIVLNHKPQIRGPELFAVDSHCKEVYYVECEIHKWTKYTSARNVKCNPPPLTEATW